MISIEESAALPDDVKLTMLKKAKIGTWKEGWRPYCLCCSTNLRMNETNYGFCCLSCGNMIGWDLQRLLESPLNQTQERPLYLVKHKKKSLF